jgi:hypothetical protein
MRMNISPGRLFRPENPGGPPVDGIEKQKVWIHNRMEDKWNS